MAVRERGRRSAVGLLVGVSAVLTAGSLALALHTPEPTARSAFVRWFDVLDEPTLPTWWSTVLLLAVALTHAAAGAAARAGGVRGANAWFAGAGIAAAFSLAELSAAHRRLGGLGRLLVGDQPLTATWIPAAAVVAVVTAAAMVAVGSRIGPAPGRLFAGGGVLLLVSAVGAEFLAGALGGRNGPGVVLAHLGEFGENLGAVAMLLAAVGVLRLARVDGELRLVHRDAAASGNRSPVDATSLWWLAAAPTALTLLSLAFVLPALAGPVSPAVREVRLYVDRLIEHNLPTWMSVSLLATAALAHVVAYLAARSAGAPSARYWLVTAAVLAGLSLDDHTQLHERTEGLGRLVATENGDFPFYWLIPGALAGLVVVAAMALLARHLHGRARLLLLGGIGLLLACALGLEVVQGMFMAEANEGLGFTLGYHVEELGEDLGSIMLMAAAVAAVRRTRVDGGFAARYTGGDRHRTDPRLTVTGK